jgi:hypothetical protein
VEELAGKVAVCFADVLPAHNADASTLELRDEAFFPAGGLIIGELVETVAEAIQALVLSETAFVDLLRQAQALFESLQDTRDTDFNEFIEIAGRNGQELDALEQWICGVVGLFEDAAIELKPALIAIEEAPTQ